MLTPTKNCSKCKKNLPIAEFSQSKTHKGGFRGVCRKCINIQWRIKYALKYREKAKERTKLWNRANKEKIKDKYLFKNYGLTSKGFEAYLSFQNSLCAICGTANPTPFNRLVVDHDHKKNLIRGLLCSKCNMGLGMFNDSNEILQRAIMYLQTNTSHKLILELENEPITRKQNKGN